MKNGYIQFSKIFRLEKFNDYVLHNVFPNVCFHIKSYVKINENKCK
jgi:hypothetical protein